jgi:ribonuclease HI
MKQTAVEWLLENLNSEPYSEKEFKYNSDCWDKAKEMEKEQIKDAANTILYHSTGPGNTAAEQYYNETFKSE